MTEVKNEATAVNIKKIVEIHLNLLMTKASVIGFDRCRTNIRERNGVKAYLRQWNPYSSCQCLNLTGDIRLKLGEIRLVLTVKDAAITKTEHLKNLIHSVYQYFKINVVTENLFKKLWDIYKEKSLKILENKD